MMTIHKFLFALAGFLLIGFAGAQDIHFTQYEFSPIHVNPAQTGAFNGSYRIGGIYRDQGRTAIKGAAYRTPMLYTDVTFPFALRKQDWTSLGLNIIDDRSGEIGLGSTKTAASAAYHFALDKMRRTVISLGAQYARATHNIKDAQDAVFPGNLLPTPNSGDNSKLQQKTSYSDISAGLSLSTKLGAKKLPLSLGVSVGHLNQPRVSLFSGAGGSDSKIKPLITANAGLEYPLNEKINLKPMLWFRNIAKPSEVITQCMGSYLLNAEKAIRLNAGLGYRFGDALQLMVGMDYGKVRAQLGYDHTISSLAQGQSPSGVGAVELGIMYTGIVVKKPNPKPKVFCPRF